MAVLVKSMQMEADLMILDEDDADDALPDLIQLDPIDSAYPGIWTLESFEVSTTVDGQTADFVFNRYLPIWVYSKWEEWDNDFRWSPRSPQVAAKIYLRKITNDETETFTVNYFDLPDFSI